MNRGFTFSFIWNTLWIVATALREVDCELSRCFSTNRYLITFNLMPWSCIITIHHLPEAEISIYHTYYTYRTQPSFILSFISFSKRSTFENKMLITTYTLVISLFQTKTNVQERVLPIVKARMENQRESFVSVHQIQFIALTFRKICYKMTLWNM